MIPCISIEYEKGVSMSKRTSKILAVVFCCLFSFSAVFAANTQARTPKQLYNHLMRQLDELEHTTPKAHSHIFRLRASITELYSHITGGKLTDPVDQNGNLISADFEKGTDLYDPCQNLKDERLKSALLKIVRNHISVGYQRAQDLVFTELDNYDGWVECVYTGRKLETNCEPDASNMNIEHTWPQSHGATGIAKSDLHHLFPTDSRTNGRRGNNPFGYVSDPDWSQGGSCTDYRVFQVRPVQRGNTARAMFYFSIRYNMDIDSRQEKVLREWHKNDPVDELEKARNDRIENFQHNRNPFIDRPDFVDRISDF